MKVDIVKVVTIVDLISELIISNTGEMKNRNLKTDEEIPVKTRWGVMFKPGEQFKDMVNDGQGGSKRVKVPKVFISYSHDSNEHAERVLALSDRLRRGGVDVVEQAIKVKPHKLGDKGSENLTNCKESGINSTSAVGCFPGGVSPYGCEEMAGNVWEWTRSLYDFKYPYKPDDGRENLEADSNTWRTIRGGSYLNDLPGVGCGVRDGYDPRGDHSSGGFRCCASPQL